MASASDPTTAGPFRLYYHPSSSASLRVLLYLSCRGVPDAHVTLVSCGLETDPRGIPVFTMPKGDPETERLGTTDLKAFNPEGRVPVLLLPDGRKMTQTGPIVDFVEDTLPPGVPGEPMLPADPWLRAQARRLMWIVASDIQPYQNIPFIIQAIADWGMARAEPTRHPLRLHFIRREFGAVETILAECAGSFAVGDAITHADCFLLPQIRNALLAELDLHAEFPHLARVWDNLIAEPAIARVLDAVGGTVQSWAYDNEKFAAYAGAAGGRS